jgi:UTP--glucose-1-phosphate uridylyltransferase
MDVTKALITAAGHGQRTLPLQTVVGRDGYPRPVLQFLVEEAVSAGIDDIGIVVNRGDATIYREAAGGVAAKLTFLEQDEARGFGHAIACGAGFVSGQAFLLMVSDHLYVSRHAGRSCARQLVEVASAENCPVSAVQSTHESLLGRFGTIGGRLFEGRRGVYEVERVVEKPTPTLAEQELAVPGLRLGHYLCFFGMHVLTPGALTVLESLLAATPDPRQITLSTALDAVDQRERHLAVEIDGRRFDLDAPFGLLQAQLALALDSPMRPRVLADLVQLLAETP